jgi:putative GTP pyrophosphokinase
VWGRSERTHLLRQSAQDYQYGNAKADRGYMEENIENMINTEMKVQEITQEDYDELIKPYQEALAILNVRLNALRDEYKSQSRNYPIHSIQQRIKAKKSIARKLQIRGLSVTAEEARESLTDIAGIRVICYFEQDIYEVVNAVKKQADYIIVKETDYIKKPKDNGYKSYHVVLGVPIYRADKLEYYPVEIQIRTLSMDLWASMEHRICYKADEDRKVSEDVRDMLKIYAQGLEEMEQDMYKCVSVKKPDA